MIFSPKTFKLDQGMDRYNPDVQSDLLSIFSLRNVEPRLGRWFSSRGYSILQNLELAEGDEIIDFGYYSLYSRQFHNFYAFTKTSIYIFDFSTGLFNPTPIYTDFDSSNIPYVILPWYNCLYITKMFNKFLRIERSVVTEIPDAPFGRYGIVANSHVYLASTGDEISNMLARLRWSDLDAPESWNLNANQSEADYFDLEPDSRQITGLSYQRGSPLIYAENNIWVAKPVGFPGGFRHEPLFPGIGNIFHNAVVRASEVDFFIGQDNIYALNGLQLQPIGDFVFEKFITSIDRENQEMVRGYLDSRKGQVFWVYRDLDNVLQSIIYNYKEQKWSERDPQGLTCFFDSPRTGFRGYDVIDDISETFDSVNTIFDDPNAGYPMVLPQLVGVPNVDGDSVIGQVDDEVFVKANEAEFAHEIETFDFFFSNVGEVNEVTKVLLEYVSSGAPNFQISIGTRANQAQSITWSAPIDINSVTNSTLSFYVREQGMGKFVRFKFIWNNDAVNFIRELRFLTLVKVEEGQNSETPQR